MVVYDIHNTIIEENYTPSEDGQYRMCFENNKDNNDSFGHNDVPTTYDLKKNSRLSTNVKDFYN